MRVASFFGLGGVGLLDPVTDSLRGDVSNSILMYFRHIIIEVLAAH